MKNKIISQSLLTAVLVVTALAASNSPVGAQSCSGSKTWNAGTSSWFTAGNWTPSGTPAPTMTAYINNGGQALIQGGSDHATACSLILGDSQGQSGLVSLDTDHTAVLDLADSSCRGTVYVGNHGSGTLSIADTAYIRARYAYVAAATNLTRPNSSGSVKVSGNGTVWYLYDTPPGCVGAGLFIGGNGSGAGGTGSVDVSGEIEVTNRADAAAVTVRGSGTLTGAGVVSMGGGSTGLSKTMNVAGTLSPGVGLEIRGNLDLTFNGNTSNTIFHVTPTARDNIQVTNATGGGTATLGGRITVLMSGTFTSLPATYNLLHSETGLNSTTFDTESITLPGGGCIAAEISYDTHDVNLVVSTSCE